MKFNVTIPNPMKNFMIVKMKLKNKKQNHIFRRKRLSRHGLFNRLGISLPT
jgi:hypothetical protein